ncbi:MAG: hypothetical protein Kow00109_25020 [Acidobacteriota bacterium]
MVPAYVLDPVFRRHETPEGHPERPARLEVLQERLGSRLAAWRRIDPRPAELGWLENVHDRGLLQRLERSAGEPETSFDPDTFAGPSSWETALLAAGSCVAAVQGTIEEAWPAALCLVRPPGHHANRDQARGFCLLNNVAVAAAWCLEQGRLGKVAVVDFDVHHGNGTQEIFFDTDRVLYVSSHQFPFYPGTGALNEVGEGAGEGFTVNFPLARGQDDSFYRWLYRDFVGPILLEYRPDMILVSAGYDAHRRDPLGGMLLTGDGFRSISRTLCEVARRVCGGRIVFCLEGGYDLDGLVEGVAATMDALEELAEGPGHAGGDRQRRVAARGSSHPESLPTPPEYLAYREAVQPFLARWWRCLR